MYCTLLQEIEIQIIIFVPKITYLLMGDSKDSLPHSLLFQITPNEFYDACLVKSSLKIVECFWMLGEIVGTKVCKIDVAHGLWMGAVSSSLLTQGNKHRNKYKSLETCIGIWWINFISFGSKDTIFRLILCVSYFLKNEVLSCFCNSLSSDFAKVWVCKIIGFRNEMKTLTLHSDGLERAALGAPDARVDWFGDGRAGTSWRYSFPAHSTQIG